MRRRGGWILGLLVAAACGGRPNPSAAPTPAGQPACPPPTAPGDAIRYGTVIVDDRPVATVVRFRLEQTDPESYTIIGEEPAELARIPVERVDLVQFGSGPDAEARYDLCPGTVAMIVQTRP